jgi:hypothetical protein
MTNLCDVWRRQITCKIVDIFPNIDSRIVYEAGTTSTSTTIYVEC